MGTYSSQPASGYDTWIDSASSDTNESSEDRLFIGEWWGGVETGRAFAKFDLSSIPLGSVVTSASFSIWTKVDYSNNARSVKLYRVKRDWVTAEVTWNSWKSGNSWTTPGAGNTTNDIDGTSHATGSTTASQAADTEIPLTFDTYGMSELSKMIWGTVSNYGWLIKYDTESDDSYDFHSSRSATPGYRPKLVVDYVVPGSPGLMIVGLFSDWGARHVKWSKKMKKILNPWDVPDWCPAPI
jgi:hypothetical protein